MMLKNCNMLVASLLLLITKAITSPLEMNQKWNSVSYQNGEKHISYIEAGPSTGHLLIFMHGWPAIAETWQSQIEHFTNLGYRVVAPDMPGYGRSTANHNFEDYAHEHIITGLLAMLKSTGRTSAVWIGHDWGAAVGSSLVATHPEVVDAMAWLAVPYRTLELGLVEVLPFINRTIYPKDQYPDGQWEYIRYYQEHFDRAAHVFDSNIGYSIKALYNSANASVIGTRSPLSEVVINGGWFGGVSEAPPANTIPLNETVLDKKLYGALLYNLNITRFYPADAYYMNNKRNRAYNLKYQKNGGHLKVPCLFLGAKYDTACDIVTSHLLDPMPAHCADFSFTNIEAGHWLALQEPAATNKAIENWLFQQVAHSQPGGGHIV